MIYQVLFLLLDHFVPGCLDKLNILFPLFALLMNFLKNGSKITLGFSKNKVSVTSVNAFEQAP